MKRRHILVVAPSAELYGSDRCLLVALPELTKEFQVTIAVPGDGPAVRLAEHLGARVVVLPDFALRRRHLTVRGLLPWWWRCVIAIHRLNRLHKRHGFSLVWSNTLAANIGPVLAMLWRVPAGCHVHECLTEPRWLPRLLTASLTRRCRVVVCNSEFTQDWVLEHRPVLADRTTVVHNGIEVPPEPSRSTPSDRFRITCVGRIHPKKGQDVLLEAFRTAREAGFLWELHFYGDALPEHRQLQAGLERYAVRHHLAEHVYWHGFEEQLDRRYGASDVAVVPSVRPEEFSLVCLEAQAMLLPVVATGPGGPSEVLRDGETGLIVPPGDAGALAGALRSLELDPSRRAAMGRAGRQRVIDHFTATQYAKSIRAAVAACVPGTDRGTAWGQSLERR